MKLKFLSSIFAFFLLTALTAQAQDDYFRVEISLRENNFATLGKNNPIIVKLKNFSELDLKTENLGKIYLYLSKCAITESSYYARAGVFTTSAAIPAKTLKKNESLVFEINPADLHWREANSSRDERKQAKNISTVPATNNCLHAGVELVEGFSRIGSRKVRLVKEFESNKLVLMPPAPPVK